VIRGLGTDFVIRRRPPSVIRDKPSFERRPAGTGISIKKEPTFMGLDNPIHIAFLLILLLLVFGAKRLPEMGRSLGTGMRGFKESLSGEATHSSLTVVQPEQPRAAADASVVTPVVVSADEPRTPAAA
jgi:sec-independent protein translocase protein TatA